MAKRVVIVGGGIIGAAAAFRLAGKGAEVLVIDAGMPGATAASFGWLNASFYHNEAHFRLRVEGLAAYARLSAEVEVPVHMDGCLSWEFEGAEQAEYAARLAALGYPVEAVDPARLREMEPHVASRDAPCLLFPGEGIGEPAALNGALLAHAKALGAQVVRGVEVLGFVGSGKRVSGVATSAGQIDADDVIVAAGTGTEALLATAGFRVPMVPRPAYVIETLPLPPVLTRVLATPEGELRQRPDGVLVMPAAVSHQGDSAETLTLPPEEAADATLARIRALLPGVDARWSNTRLAHRPMPEDGLPVVGRLADGLTVAVMHSGLTLGALMGECLAEEIMDGATCDLLGPFRPGRFGEV